MSNIFLESVAKRIDSSLFTNTTSRNKEQPMFQ